MTRPIPLVLLALVTAAGCVAAPISSEGAAAPSARTGVVAHESSEPKPSEPTARKSEPLNPAQCERVVIETPRGPLPVAVEIAATPAARKRGLMGRQVLPAGTGMLFVFDEMAVQTFWMRNTPLSLDMIFISGPPTGQGARIVGIVHEAVPRSHEIRSVEAKSRFVLEVPGGWSRAQGLSRGMAVRFEAREAPESAP